MDSLHSLKKEKDQISKPKEQLEDKQKSGNKIQESLEKYQKNSFGKQIKKEKNTSVSNSSSDDSYEISQNDSTQKNHKNNKKNSDDINIKSILLLNAHKLQHEGMKNHLLKDILKNKIPDQTVITNNLMMERYDIVLKSILEVFIDYLHLNEHNHSSTNYLLSKHARSFSQNILNQNPNLQNNQMFNYIQQLDHNNQQIDNKYSMQFLKNSDNISQYNKCKLANQYEAFQNVNQFSQQNQYLEPYLQTYQQQFGQNFELQQYGRNLQMNQQNQFYPQQMNQFDIYSQSPLPNFETKPQNQQLSQRNIQSNNGSMIFQSQPPNSKDYNQISSLAAIPSSTKSNNNDQILKGYQFPQNENNQQYQQNNGFQQEKSSPLTQKEKNMHTNSKNHKGSRDSQGVQNQYLTNQKSIDLLEIPQQKLERKSSSSQRFCDVRKNRKQEQLMNQTLTQIGDIRSLSYIQVENQQKLQQQMQQQQQNQQYQQQLQNQQFLSMQQNQLMKQKEQQKDLQQFNTQFREPYNNLINQKPTLDKYNLSQPSTTFMTLLSPENNLQFQNSQKHEINNQDFSNINPISSLQKLPSFTQYQSNSYSQQKSDYNKVRQQNYQGLNSHDQANLNFEQNGRFQSLPQTRQNSFHNPDTNGTINDHLQIYRNKPSIIHQSNQIFANKPQHQVHFSHRYSNIPLDSFNASVSRSTDSNFQNISKILNNNSNPSLDQYQSPDFKSRIQMNGFNKAINQEQGYYQNSDIGMYGSQGGQQNQQLYNINLRAVEQNDEELEYSNQLKVEPSFEQSQQDNSELSRQTSLQKNIRENQNKLNLNLNKDNDKKIPQDENQSQRSKLAHSKFLNNVFKQNFSALSSLNSPTSVRNSNKLNKKAQPLKLMPCHKAHKSATIAVTRRYSDNSLNSTSTQNIPNQSMISKEQSGSKTCKNCQIYTNREDAKQRFSKLPPSIEQVGKKGKTSPQKDTKMREIFSYPVSDAPKESKQK